MNGRKEKSTKSLDAKSTVAITFVMKYAGYVLKEKRSSFDL